ncbi:fumarylacetoacetate hydrolase family protein [Serratia sp. NA_13]|uniref:fumarylacetoacetate hydrolase family protein n=1 Tax=Serratia sp. NA_13 TaxID=3415658 RepID=UPI004046F4C0
MHRYFCRHRIGITHVFPPDKIGDPNALDLSIRVNGQLRQHSNTRHLIYNVQRLIAYASAMFTL